MDFEKLLATYQSAAATTTEVPQEPVMQSAPAPIEQPRRRWRKPRFEPRVKGEMIRLPNGEFDLVNMYGKYDLWDGDWTGAPDDVVVIFEAKAANDVTVAFTSSRGTTDGHMYEIVVGGWKNSKSVVRTEAQGPERAVCFDPRMCNSETYITYWVVLTNGHVACGTGDQPGMRTLIAWKQVRHHPEEPQPCWVTFTNWDGTVHLRSIRVGKASALCPSWQQFAGTAEEWTQRFVPSYIQAFEEERIMNTNRAERFGVAVVPPSRGQAFGRMSHVDRERARAAQAGRLKQGFATGFDMESEEEVQARESRAERFGIESRDNVDVEVPLLPSAEELEEKRARAERFGIPLVEQSSLVDLSIKIPIKRREFDPNTEQIRNESVHIFGDMSKMQSVHILRAFQEFNPSHIEWLNDYSCNVVFADEFTCDRAIVALTREVPPPLISAVELTPERKAFDDELSSIRSQGWRFMAMLDGRKAICYFLIRRATSGDVKAAPSDAEPLSLAGSSNPLKRARGDSGDEPSKRIAGDQEA